MSYKNGLEQNNADLQDILMTASNLPIYETIPMELISLQCGAANAVSDGWAFCDGTNGMPDLKNRFVVGAGNSYAVGLTGGTVKVRTIGEVAIDYNISNEFAAQDALIAQINEVLNVQL